MENIGSLPEDLAEFAKKYMLEQEERKSQVAAFKLLCEEIEAGRIIKPLWKINPIESDFDAQGFNWYRAGGLHDGSVPAFIRKGHTTVYAKIENIFLALGNEFGNKYRENEYLADEVKCYRILQHWVDGEELVPPHFKHLHSKVYDVVDGRHRLNLAYFLGKIEVPLIIPVFEELKIKKILKIK